MTDASLSPKDSWIFLIGDHGAGKSALVSQIFAQKEYSKFPSTFGYEYNVCKQDDETFHILQVTDTSSENHVFYKLLDKHYAHSVIILTLDIRKPNLIQQMVTTFLDPIVKHQFSDLSALNNLKQFYKLTAADVAHDRSEFAKVPIPVFFVATFCDELSKLPEQDFEKYIKLLRLAALNYGAGVFCNYYYDDDHLAKSLLQVINVYSQRMELPQDLRSTVESKPNCFILPAWDSEQSLSSIELPTIESNKKNRSQEEYHAEEWITVLQSLEAIPRKVESPSKSSYSKSMSSNSIEQKDFFSQFEN